MTFEELNATLDNKNLKTCKRCQRGEIYQIHAPYLARVWGKDGVTTPKTGYFATKLNHVNLSGLCGECETEVNKRKYDELDQPSYSEMPNN